MNKFRIWTYRSFDEDSVALLDGIADVFSAPYVDIETLCRIASSCSGIVIDSRTVLSEYAMNLMGSDLRVIARTGIGVDNIDLTAATKRGILVVNTPDAPTESTAEHTIALLLSLTKQVTFSDRLLRSGQGFQGASSLQLGVEIVGTTLGLVGLGRVGARVADIAKSLGIAVTVYDPYVSEQQVKRHAVSAARTLDELLSSADFVSLHCPLTPDTYRMINSVTIRRMNPGSILINTARGGLVDENALIEALESNFLRAAGLDVYDPEPPRLNHPLFKLPNTICTTHSATDTRACILRMERDVCEQIAMALKGLRPTSLVNEEVWIDHNR